MTLSVVKVIILMHCFKEKKLIEFITEKVLMRLNRVTVRAFLDTRRVRLHYCGRLFATDKCKECFKVKLTHGLKLLCVILNVSFNLQSD